MRLLLPKPLHRQNYQPQYTHCRTDCPCIFWSTARSRARKFCCVCLQSTLSNFHWYRLYPKIETDQGQVYLKLGKIRLRTGMEVTRPPRRNPKAELHLYCKYRAYCRPRKESCHRADREPQTGTLTTWSPDHICKSSFKSVLKWFLRSLQAWNSLLVDSTSAPTSLALSVVYRRGQYAL